MHRQPEGTDRQTFAYTSTEMGKSAEDERRQDDASERAFAARNSNFSERRRACAPSEIKNKSRRQQVAKLSQVREIRGRWRMQKGHAGVILRF